MSRALSIEALVVAIVDERLRVAGVMGPSRSRWTRLADLSEKKRALEWIRTGKLPTARPGKHTLVDVTIYDQLVADHDRRPVVAFFSGEGDVDASTVERILSGGRR